MKNVYLYGFATFGHPNDFRQSPFIYDKDFIARNIKVFDLTNAIKVFPNSKLYAIRKEYIDDLRCISYVLYSYSKEMSSTRDGTFIGSSILFTNEIAEENITVNNLNEFHNILVDKNTDNFTLKVNHSKDFEHSADFLDNFKNNVFNFRNIEEPINYNVTNNIAVIYSRIDIENLALNFQKSLKLLNKFDTVFFTDSIEIIEYCKNKNIFKVIDEKGFDNELMIIEEERKQKVLNSISELGKEKQKLQTDKERVIIELKNHLKDNELKHIENEANIKEEKLNIEKISSLYDVFSKLLDDYSNQLRTGRKLEDVKALYNENKKIFLESVKKFSQPKYTKNLSKIKPNPRLTVESQSPEWQENNRNKPFQNVDNKRNIKINIYKIGTILFLVLWILTLSYFFFKNKNEKNINQDFPVTNSEVQTSSPTIKQIEEEKEKIIDLTPAPNSQLNENDLKIVNKQNIKNKTVNEIVEIIYKKNPTDIGQNYIDQKDTYAKLLISKNNDCFKDKVCISDSLKIIPSYKK